MEASFSEIKIPSGQMTDGDSLIGAAGLGVKIPTPSLTREGWGIRKNLER